MEEIKRNQKPSAQIPKALIIITEKTRNHLGVNALI